MDRHIKKYLESETTEAYGLKLAEKLGMNHRIIEQAKKMELNHNGK